MAKPTYWWGFCMTSFQFFFSTMLLFYNILYTFIKSLGIYTVYSRQDMEATDRWMDKEDVIHTHTHTMGYDSARKQNEIMPFAATWMNLEIFILSEISQIKKDKYHVMSLICRIEVQFSSVAQSCPTLCDPTDCSTPGLPIHHQLPEFTQTHVIKSVMPFNHLIFCHPLLLPPSICQH